MLVLRFNAQTRRRKDSPKEAVRGSDGPFPTRRVRHADSASIAAELNGAQKVSLDTTIIRALIIAYTFESRAQELLALEPVGIWGQSTAKR
jgi:hypothetical protein